MSRKFKYTLLVGRLLIVTCVMTLGIIAQRSSSAATTTPQFTVLPPGTPFALNSAWNQTIPANPPLDANSNNFIADLTKQVNDNYGGVAGINTTSYAASLYIAAADTPTTTVTFNNCQNKSGGYDGFLSQMTAAPIPSDAVPASGTDAEIAIYQPSSDTIWEMWVSTKSGSNWSACWGGKLTNVSKNPGIFSFPYGTTATGLPFFGAEPRVSEFYAGEIKHAIGLALINTRRYDYFSYPANRSDGYTADSNTLPEGSRLQLDPSLNLDAYNLNPAAKLIAKAAQQYGFIIDDKSGIVGVRAENPTPYITAGVGDPYTSAVTINGVSHPAIFGSTAGYAVMKNFPWDKLRVVACDYGKPSNIVSHCAVSATLPPSSGTAVPKSPPTASNNIISGTDPATSVHNSTGGAVLPTPQTTTRATSASNVSQPSAAAKNTKNVIATESTSAAATQPKQLLANRSPPATAQSNLATRLVAQAKRHRLISVVSFLILVSCVIEIAYLFNPNLLRFNLLRPHTAATKNPIATLPDVLNGSLPLPSTIIRPTNSKK